MCLTILYELISVVYCMSAIKYPKFVNKYDIEFIYDDVAVRTS